MSQKSISVFMLVFFFLGGGFAHASVVINEVKISPTEDRFIKLYNPDSSDVDLTNWYIQRKTATGSSFGSLVSKTNFENKKIGANGYFLISRSPTDNSDIVLGDLTLTESNAIQLKNGEGVVVDKVCWGESSDCGASALPNPTPGESVLVTSHIATPVPAPEASSDSSGVASGNASSSSTSASAPKPKVIENPTMKVKILANTLAFTGEPLEIKTSVSGFSNENVVLGRAYWNFGDGGSLEQINNFEKFSHTYYYPGEYVLFLEYYQNSFSKTPEATSKMTIKVLPTTVTISKVGDAKDFFIELSNNASSDIDISNWFIMANGKTFVLPKNSVIMSKKQMTISGKITGFSYSDQADLKLYSGTGELVFDYLPPVVPVKILAKNSVPVKISTALQPLGEAIPPPAEQIPAENLLATPAGNQVSLPPLIIPLASLVFIGTSAGAVYFIRRKKIIPQTGNDFEILGE